MKALKVTLLEPINVEPVRALSRGLGRFIFATSVLVILFAGTFPFDFTLSQHRTPFDWRPSQYDPMFADRGQNILFFIPFGFGFAAIIRTRLNRSQWRLGTAPLASLALSLFVEGAQSLVSFRDPTLMDLWTNTLGGTIGAGVYVLFGDRMLAWMARGLLRVKHLATPALVGSLLAGYAVLHLTVPLILRDPGDLSGWDPDLPLILGNERTGDRPWNGIIHNVLLGDRAITDREVARLHEGESPSQVMGDSLLAHYQPRGAAPYPDLQNQLPPLDWAGARPTSNPSEDAPRLDPPHWLATSQSIAPAIQRIQRSSEFTFATTVTTFDLGQRGPARLASISGGTTSRNIQLGQEIPQPPGKRPFLVVRVRNALRSTPELYVHDAFEAGVPRNIVVTSRAAETIVYLDGREEGRMKITPEAKIIWRLYPRSFRLRLEQYGFRAYAAIYRAIIFIPFVALLGATLLLLPWKPPPKAVLAVTSLLAVAVMLEAMLSRLGGRFELINLFISLTIGFGTLGGLILWRRVKDAHD